MLTAGAAILEILRAALLLALFALNFAHAPTIASYDTNVDRAVAATISLCGDIGSTGDGRHAPCHACRLGAAADLPPPPAVPLPCGFFVEPVHYAQLSDPLTAVPQVASYLSRGPPSLT